MKTNWTDKKIDKLKKYMMKGLSTSEIGKKMDMSKNAIIGKIHRMNLNEIVKKEMEEALAKQGGLFKFGKKSPEAKQGLPVKKEKKISKTEAPVIAPKKEVETKKTATKKTPAKKPIVIKTDNPDVGVLLQDLQYNTCRWPLDEINSEGETLFCGCETPDKKQYCMKHLEEAYVKQDDKK